jgi:hypothetical protein
VQIIDKWKSQTLDGTTVTYTIIGTQDSGYVYSVDCKGRSVRVDAPQGPLTRERIEALFADSVSETWSRIEQLQDWPGY